MGKKNRKKRKNKMDKWAGKIFPKEKWEIDCKHPLSVTIGKHKVTIIAWEDFEFKKHKDTVDGIDVFIGLTELGFKGYEHKRPYYANPLLQKMSDRFNSWIPSLSNLICLEIPDGGTDEEVFSITRDLLKEGKKIGFGCYAGHGRTGWLLARLIKYFERSSGDEAVRRARKRLCVKCVETIDQIRDLGCSKEIGWYVQRTLWKEEAQGKKPHIVSPFPLASTASAGTYYDNWLQKKLAEAEETPEDPVIEPDTVEDITPELVEAWRKMNNEEDLSEEEEWLIANDRSTGNEDG